MGLSFEVQRTAEGGGRRGALTLPHGVVETPVFMPVGTAASVKAVEQGVLAGLGDGGADVVMAFDECVETPATWARTQESMGLTHAWARRSKDYFEKHKHEVPWFEELGGRPQSLVGIVQGGMYADLRKESAERLVEM